MKLAAGTKKIILTNEAHAAENERRHRANGRIYKPVFVVWAISPNGEKAVAHECFTFKAAKLTPRTTVGDFPFKWAPTFMRNTRVWLETDGEVDLTLTQPEDL